MKSTINNISYTFSIESVDGSPVLAASYTQNGESHTIWTADYTQLPTDDADAASIIENCDWAVEQESMLDYNKR